MDLQLSWPIEKQLQNLRKNEKTRSVKPKAVEAVVIPNQCVEHSNGVLLANPARTLSLESTPVRFVNSEMTLAGLLIRVL
jgi:hypothetical protein